MLPTRTTETPAIDRTACPSRGGHGTAHFRYKHGCTCRDAARDAAAKRCRQERGISTNRLVDSTGTARYLQAAAVRGHTLGELAAALDVDRELVNRWRKQQYATVSRDTAARVRRVVVQLLEQPLPADGGVRGRNPHARTRAHARREQWVPLGEWSDIDDPGELPDRYYRRDRRPAVVGRERPAQRIPEAVVDAIRADYRAADPAGFRPVDVAARHGVSRAAVTRAVRGYIGAETANLVDELGPKFPSRGRPARAPIDLAAHKRGEHTAAPPTGRATPKESAA